MTSGEIARMFNIDRNLFENFVQENAIKYFDDFNLIFTGSGMVIEINNMKVNEIVNKFKEKYGY